VTKHLVGFHDRDNVAFGWKPTFGYSARQEALIAKKNNGKKLTQVLGLLLLLFVTRPSVKFHFHHLRCLMLY
jgi:hypothetical protein